MMRALFFIAAIVLTGLVSPVGFAHAQDDSVQFFEVLGDVPLMPGLIEQPGAGLSFDKPGGRVVESVAGLNGLSVDSVRVYYEASLPQFGWVPAGENRFIRQGERLEILFEDDAGVMLVRLSIQPR